MTKVFFIRANHISRIENCSYCHAVRKLNQIRYALKKENRKPITLQEYCQFNQISAAEVLMFLTDKV